ncbi:hypothetical protein EV667_4214 [Ancylobacter aquaticus]|uniref:Uncharacterized protein n=1 Tax=Ancylobacter aquaticus TaxID=100 RepID=A0A4V2PH82_ANCAQ|nr:hypothetical protein [Ancylobacter aquaticus]TCK19756.1 hypothetical protein EV667_4214 [Ancylobacter aquaticus]
MWDFSISRSLGLMGRTMPFIALRVAVYFGMAVAYVAVTGTGAGIGWGIGAFGDDGFRSGAMFWGGAVGFGLTAGVLYLLREYILYVVKAGHIAVLVELLDGRDMPVGKSQVAHAAAVVKLRFGEASVLFVLDQLVKGVLRVVTGLVRGIASFLPIPGIQSLSGILHAFLNMSVGFIDEVILAYAIRTGSTNPWQSARTALVLYGQNYKPMLKNAAWLTIIVYGLSFLVFLLMLAPAAALVWLLPGGWSAGGFVFALIFAWAVKAALIEPFAITCMMDVYFRTIEGQAPNPEWDARLSSLSKQFNTIKDKAAHRQGAPEAPRESYA